MADPVIITCAVTGGGDTAGRSEAVPVTPAAIATSAIDAGKAGAAAHFAVPGHGQNCRTSPHKGGQGWRLIVRLPAPEGRKGDRLEDEICRRRRPVRHGKIDKPEDNDGEQKQEPGQAPGHQFSLRVATNFQFGSPARVSRTKVQ